MMTLQQRFSEARANAREWLIFGRDAYGIVPLLQ
jgi:hypothetical protein